MSNISTQITIAFINSDQDINDHTPTQDLSQFVGQDSIINNYCIQAEVLRWNQICDKIKELLQQLENYLKYQPTECIIPAHYYSDDCYSRNDIYQAIGFYNFCLQRLDQSDYPNSASAYVLIRNNIKQKNDNIPEFKLKQVPDLPSHITQLKCGTSREEQKQLWVQDQTLYPLPKYEFEYRGLQCSILRHTWKLTWNGYVAVPTTNPYYGKSYNDIEGIIEVHGGLTFSETKDSVTTFGFDTCHSGDMSFEENPLGFNFIFRTYPGATYKIYDYVLKEVKRLADQLLLQSSEAPAEEEEKSSDKEQEDISDQGMQAPKAPADEEDDRKSSEEEQNISDQLTQAPKAPAEQNIIDTIDKINEILDESNKYLKIQEVLNKIKSYLEEPNKLHGILMMYLENYMMGFTPIQRECMINFTVFEFNRSDEKHKVYMNCILKECADEGIYSIEELEQSKTNEITFGSRKGNYDNFIFTDEIPTVTDESTKCIDARTLFPETPIRHYKGNMTTRGGYTGWNWFTIPIPQEQEKEQTNSTQQENISEKILLQLKHRAHQLIQVTEEHNSRLKSQDYDYGDLLEEIKSISDQLIRSRQNTNGYY